MDLPDERRAPEDNQLKMSRPGRGSRCGGRRRGIDGDATCLMKLDAAVRW